MTGREQTCGHGNTDIHGRCPQCRADASVNPDTACPAHAAACPAKKGREHVTPPEGMWTCTCGYQNVGSICTHCAALPGREQVPKRWQVMTLAQRLWEQHGHPGQPCEPGSTGIGSCALREAAMGDSTGLEQTCPSGCGCRVGTDDADSRDCQCIGPCCYDWDAEPCSTPGCVGVMVTALYGYLAPYCSSRDAGEPCTATRSES